MTYLLWALLILVFIDDLLVRHSSHQADFEWRGLLAARDHQIRRLKRRIRQSLTSEE